MASNISEEEVKKQVTSLLISNVRVSTIDSLSRDYLEVIGHEIPVRALNYSCVEHFLKSIPDICVVEGSGFGAKIYPIINAKNSHINEMVTRQKVTVSKRFGSARSSKKKQNSPRHFGYNHHNFRQTSRQFNKPNMHSSRLNHNNTICTNRNGEVEIHNSNKHITPLMENLQRPGVNYLNNKLPPNAPLMTYDTFEQIVKTQFEKETSDIKKESQVNFNNSLTSKFNELKVDDEEDTSTVPNRVQENLKKLICQYPDGIWCCDLTAKYRQQFRRELAFLEYGYTNLIHMCMDLKSIFVCIQPGQDDYKLFDRNKPLPPSIQKFCTKSGTNAGKLKGQKDALPELTWSDFQDFIPSDILKFGESIPQQFFPETTKSGDVFEVVISEIYDPSKFWFYLGTRKQSVFDDLMDELQIFYKDSSNIHRYAIPPGICKEGLYCVNIYCGEYHRAKVVKILTDDTARIFYIDCGTLSKVSIKSLYFLQTDFTKVPAQAIRCRLANIIPIDKGHPWPLSTTIRFREMVNGRNTKIKISHIDWNEEVLWVFLADITNPKNVFYINENLVSENHALWTDQHQRVPLVISEFVCLVGNLHLYPTFVELENALVPSSTAMQTVAEKNVPIQFCIPQYFKLDQMALDDINENIKGIEDSFIETIRNRRLIVRLNVSLLNLDPDPIDFDVFGALKDDIIGFCEKDDSYKKLIENLKQPSVDYIEKNDILHTDLERSEILRKQLESYKQISSSSSSDFDSNDSPISFHQNDISSSRLIRRRSQTGRFRLNSLDSDINIFDHPESFELNSLRENDLEGKTETFITKPEVMPLNFNNIASSNPFKMSDHDSFKQPKHDNDDLLKETSNIDSRINQLKELPNGTVCRKLFLKDFCNSYVPDFLNLPNSGVKSSETISDEDFISSLKSTNPFKQLLEEQQQKKLQKEFHLSNKLALETCQSSIKKQLSFIASDVSSDSSEYQEFESRTKSVPLEESEDIRLINSEPLLEQSQRRKNLNANTLEELDLKESELRNQSVLPHELDEFKNTYFDTSLHLTTQSDEENACAINRQPFWSTFKLAEQKELHNSKTQSEPRDSGSLLKEEVNPSCQQSIIGNSQAWVTPTLPNSHSLYQFNSSMSSAPGIACPKYVQWSNGYAPIVPFNPHWNTHSFGMPPNTVIPPEYRPKLLRCPNSYQMQKYRNFPK
ncbi:hypothetical protein ABEB36_004115 [Hypothenemus hampei]|uniref:Tudor domain-containing protein n=1 Tax=Hypothenemus hampei TaxID=57062 RepID=A0ABD1F293_HYPHA